MSTGTSQEDSREQVREDLERYLDPSRRQILLELVGTTERQQEGRIRSMCLGTKIAFEMASLIKVEDTGEDFFKVTIQPRLQVALEIVKEDSSINS